MRILAVEPTPNPNVMKLMTDHTLPPEERLYFRADQPAGAPDYLRALLTIPGVRSVYQVADFIALERHPKADWRAILARAGASEAAEPGAEAGAGEAGDPAFTGVQVLVQVFRGIPMQVKLTAGGTEQRLALPDRFKQAVLAAAGDANVVLERRWQDLGLRYGEMAEVGAQVVEELTAAYDEERVQRLVAQAQRQGAGVPAEAAGGAALAPAEVASRLRDPDWRRRYGALEQMEPAVEALPVVVQALTDDHSAIRRLAVAYLGAIGGEAVTPHLLRALRDPAPAVRRAAGDAFSDLGDPAAIPEMARLLQADPSRIVRWRAARYLYELGDGSAVPALRAALDDPEFEVALQARMALERIEGGGEAAEPAWKLMTRDLDGV